MRYLVTRIEGRPNSSECIFCEERYRNNLNYFRNLKYKCSLVEHCHLFEFKTDLY